MRAVALTLSALLLTTPAIAQDADLPVEACAAAVGTFLLSDATDTDEATTRSLFLLTNGGHAEFVDSGQWGGNGYAPFSDALGSWVCLSEAGENPQLRAVVLDFTFAEEGDQQIGRLDIEGTFDLDTGQLTLTALLSFFPLDGDPLTGPADDAEPFTVVGQKITAPQ
jgi:hypothetical protein